MEEKSTRPLVLVIDDDEGIREGIVDLLEEEGFAAVGAANGLEALNFLSETKQVPSLILLDLMMPVLDGWTFCKVRQGVAMLMEIPVVAISAAPMNGPHEPLRVDATLAQAVRSGCARVARDADGRPQGVLRRARARRLSGLEHADHRSPPSVWKDATLDTRAAADPGSGHDACLEQATRRRWSQRVTRTSDALDLEAGVFRMRVPAGDRAVARRARPRRASGARRRRFARRCRC